MQESQLSQHIQQHKSPTMVKSIPSEESQLCDDILSCILALDEVIAEFDDTNSLSSFPPSDPSVSCVTSSSTCSVPIETTRQTAINNYNHNNHQSDVKIKSQLPQSRLECEFDGSTIVSSLSTDKRPSCVGGKEDEQKKYDGSQLAPISIKGIKGMMNNITSSQVQAEVKQDIMAMNKQLVTSFDIPHHNNQGKDKDKDQNQGEDHVQVQVQDEVKFRLGNELRDDLIRKSTSPNGKFTKIPTLKNSSSSTVISSSVTTPTTVTSSTQCTGGSFPKVKMRSCPNPLLEYRSVKMSNFVLPDELPPELMKENWYFSPGKNLPRSLARTRETCIADGDGQIPKSKNPRFTETSKNDGKNNSRIPRFNKNESNGNGNTNGSSNIPVPKPRKNVEKSPKTSPIISSSANPQTSELDSKKHEKASSPISPSSIQTQFYFNSPQEHGHGQGKSKSNRMQKRRLEFCSSDGQKISRQNGKSTPSTGQLIPETDDGYLSMINRSEEYPPLWPEEMIENEIFSQDELKRLSFTPINIDGGAEKTDYFSDDSLESESTGLTESFSSASNGKGTYSKPTKVRSNAIDYFGNPQLQQQDSSITVGMVTENQTPSPSKPVSFFVPLETKNSNNNNNGKKRKGKKKFQQLLNPTPISAEEVKAAVEIVQVESPTKSNCAKNIDQASPKKKRDKVKVVNPDIDITVNKSPQDFVTPQSTQIQTCSKVIKIESEQEQVDDVIREYKQEEDKSLGQQVIDKEKSDKISTVVVDSQGENLIVKESQSKSKELETKESEILRKIEDFAEKLASKIERSGSEEAAATITLNQVEIELQNLNCWTSFKVEEQGDLGKKEEQVVVMSNNINNIQVPDSSSSGIQINDESTAENVLSQEFDETSQPEQDPPVITSINIFIPGDESTVSKKDVDTVLSNIVETPPPASTVEANSLEDFDWEEQEQKAQENVKSLRITEDCLTQDGKRRSIRNDDDDDNTSDGLSETPPEFIPELPPPVISPIPPTDVLLDKIALWNATALSQNENKTKNDICTTNTVPHAKSSIVKNSLFKTKDNNGTSKSFSYSPTNGTFSKLREESIPNNWKQSGERNSRSSEDLIQALNSDTRTSSSMNRLGASTLPLNARPPTSGGGGPLRPLRNMFNRFRRSKNKRSSMSLSEHSTTLSDLPERPNARPVAMYLPHDINDINESETNESRHYSNSERKTMNNTDITTHSAKKPNFLIRMFSRKK